MEHYCVDCKYHVEKRGVHVCTREISLVTGKEREKLCEDERYEEHVLDHTGRLKYCGKQGCFFEPKEESV